MDNFNLIDSPWIPVRWSSAPSGSTPALVSLHDAFSRSQKITDLDCAPHERIALTRLLVCITHAVCGAPEDSDDWGGFGGDLETKVSAYLNRADIHDCFNLLGDGVRFLQENVPSIKDPVPCSKLFPSLATGNNPTLLDHSGMATTRAYSPASIALALLTFQNFYPLYGAGFRGRGPCSDGNSIHVLLIGDSLHATIVLNLLDMETITHTSPGGLGSPIWECPDEAQLSQVHQTFLGRLVPRHRSLKLTTDLTGFHHRKDSLQYPGWEPYREPSSTIILNKKDERRILPARIDRSIWRDLHSITALQAGTGNAQLNPNAAPVLRSHEEELENDTTSLWTGALITDLKAKILDTAESTFTVPRNLFCDSGRNIYAAGIDHAENVSNKLYGAIKTCWGGLMHESAPTTEGKKHYWHSLDQNHRELMSLAGNPDSRRGKASFGEAGADDPWTELVRQAALNAYDAVCPHTTPRQIQAYAAGSKILMRVLYPKKNPAKKAARKTTSIPQS